MFFVVNVCRTRVNPIFLNLCNGRKGFVRYISSSIHEKSVHVEPEVREFPELVKSDEDKGKITDIMEEYNAAKSTGKRVPSNLSCDQMAELMILPTKSQRKKYLAFLHRKELYFNAKVKKKAQLAENRKPRVDIESDHIAHIKYGTGFNSLFPRMTPAKIKKLHKRLNAGGMLFKQNLVIDLDYDDYMAKWEAKNVAYQLCVLNSSNRTRASSFNIYLCNADRSKLTMQYIEKSFPDIWDDYLITCSTSSYVDIFPKEKLVYLSPHAEEVLECYSHDATYIIGGFVDKRIKKPLSYEKAKREGISCCRLPLDEHIKWKAGTKSLTLDQVVNILLEMKVHNDWKKALQFVPIRKIGQWLEDDNETVETFSKKDCFEAQ